MKKIIFSTIALAALGAAIYGAFVIHQKTVVNNSLNQVFNSGTNQAAVFKNLQTMGAKAVPAEVQALSQTGEVGSAAELALLNNKSATNALPDIMRLLEAKNPETRQRAASIVMGQIANASHVSTEYKSFLPALIRALNDTNEYVREDMALTLSRFGSTAETAVPALTKALDDGSARVRIAAAMALSKIGNGQKVAAIPILKNVIANGDGRDRHWAAVYLYAIDPKNTELIPVFIGSLTNDDVGIRSSAAYSLLPYGSQAKIAVPALQKALDDPDTDVRKAARQALETIDPATLNKSNVQNQ